MRPGRRSNKRGGNKMKSGKSSDTPNRGSGLQAENLALRSLEAKLKKGNSINYVIHTLYRRQPGFLRAAELRPEGVSSPRTLVSCRNRKF